MITNNVYMVSIAAVIGIVHVLMGPDHYLPISSVAAARGWDRKKTIAYTLLCGVLHVGAAGSLSMGGVFLGKSVINLTKIEHWRTELACWGLITLGLVYAVMALRSSIKQNSIKDFRASPAIYKESRQIPFLLAVILIVGPCEPLIPLLMAASSLGTPGLIAIVSAVFFFFTVFTMLAMVLIFSGGFIRIAAYRNPALVHVLSSLAIILSGIGVKLFGF